MNWKLLKINSYVCFSLGVVMVLIALVIFIALITDYTPDFLTGPIRWILEKFPSDDGPLLFLCFIGLTAAIIVMPFLLAYLLLKKAIALSKKARRERTLTTNFYK